MDHDFGVGIDVAFPVGSSGKKDRRHRRYFTHADTDNITAYNLHRVVDRQAVDDGTSVAGNVQRDVIVVLVRQIAKLTDDVHGNVAGDGVANLDFPAGKLFVLYGGTDDSGSGFLDDARHDHDYSPPDMRMVTAWDSILNGTTNFILTKMEEEGLSYQEALGMAQEKGFAEADPTADVDGLDAANKLSILISLVFGISAPPAQIPTRGISNVSSIDMDFASEMDFRIKMLASAKEENGKVYAAVSPALVPVDHPLASVANEFNAVFLTGNAVDDLMFYGRGAGAMPTGSAVVGDVIGVARKFEKDSDYDLVPQLRYDGGLDFAGEGSGRYYVRMTAPDQPGVLGRITTILGWHNISIDTVVQRPQKKAKGQSSTAPGSATLLFIFQKAEKKVIDRALSEILLDKAVTSVENVMRVVEE